MPPSSIELLPQLVLKEIFQKLPRKDFRNVRLVSKFFAPALSLSEKWEELLQEDFNISLEEIKAAGIRGGPIAKRSYIKLNTLARSRTFTNVNSFGLCEDIISAPANSIVYLKIIMNDFEEIDIESATPKEILNYASSAALAGKVEYLEHLIEKSTALEEYKEILLKCGLISGSLEMAHYLINRYECAVNNFRLNDAALSGSIELVDKIIKHYNLTPNDDLIEYAAQSGSVTLVKHLVNKYHLATNFFMIHRAAEHGQLTMLRYLMSDLGLDVRNRRSLLADCCRNRFDVNPYNMLEIIEYLINVAKIEPEQDDNGISSVDPLKFATIGCNMVAANYLLNTPGLKPNDTVWAAVVNLPEDKKLEFTQLYRTYEGDKGNTQVMIKY